MKAYRITLSLQSAFATPLKGDTLFGQLCWAVRNRLGEAQLDTCLEGYTQNRPFAVISDAFPAGYLPLPKLPSCFYKQPDSETIDRKALKKRAWLPEEQLHQPVSEWLGLAVEAKTIAKNGALSQKHSQHHNSINRQTGTTGEEGFAPYSVEQDWFLPAIEWAIYLMLDTERLSEADCQQCLSDIGLFGFGRDASIGMGKFTLTGFIEHNLPAQASANACLTLAPCAPQGLGFNSAQSFYQLFTRFGRHGDWAVHQEGKPFKNPVLLAQTAAVFSTQPPPHGFIGQGLGGDGLLSKTLKETVQQGYAPIIAINFNAHEFNVQESL